jgi:hypothetical protein
MTSGGTVLTLLPFREGMPGGDGGGGGCNPAICSRARAAMEVRLFIHPEPGRRGSGEAGSHTDGVNREEDIPKQALKKFNTITPR